MTDSTGFTQTRSDAIREELVDVVDERPVRRWRRIGVGAALVLSGVLVGGGAVTATAQIWSPEPASPPPYGSPTDNPGIVAPAGLTPGQPVVVPLGGPTVYEIEGEERVIPLEPAEGATHVRVSVTCTSPGSTGWGVDASGNNPRSICSAADVAPGASGMAWMDFEIAGHDRFYVQPDSGVTSIVTLQYLNVVDTAWGVNANGETFGVAKPGVGDPELMRAVGVDAQGVSIEGYVRSSDLNVQCPGMEMPTSPEQALEQQERCGRDYPNGFDVPLYESDGVTQIGTFHVG